MHTHQVLLPAFTRSLLDPFPPGRIAALMSLSVTMEYYPAADIARKLLPSVGMCAVDPEKEVRAKAVECLKAALARLEHESAKMSEEIPLQGGGVVAAPTMTDGGVMGWASSAATASLSKTLWGVGEGTSMGKGEAGLKASGDAGAAGAANSAAAKGSKAQKATSGGDDVWDGVAGAAGDTLAEWAAPDKSASAKKGGGDDWGNGFDDDWGGGSGSAGRGDGSLGAGGKKAQSKKASAADDWGSLLDDGDPFAGRVSASSAKGAARPAVTGGGSDLDDLFGPATKQGKNDDGWGALNEDLNTKKPPAAAAVAAAAAASQRSASKTGKAMKLGGATKLDPKALDDWDDW